MPKHFLQYKITTLHTKTFSNNSHPRYDRIFPGECSIHFLAHLRTKFNIRLKIKFYLKKLNKSYQRAETEQGRRPKKHKTHPFLGKGWFLMRTTKKYNLKWTGVTHVGALWHTSSRKPKGVSTLVCLGAWKCAPGHMCYFKNIKLQQSPLVFKTFKIGYNTNDLVQFYFRTRIFGFEPLFCHTPFQQVEVDSRLSLWTSNIKVNTSHI